MSKITYMSWILVCLCVFKLRKQTLQSLFATHPLEPRGFFCRLKLCRRLHTCRSNIVWQLIQSVCPGSALTGSYCWNVHVFGSKTWANLWILRQMWNRTAVYYHHNISIDIRCPVVIFTWIIIGDLIFHPVWSDCAQHEMQVALCRNRHILIYLWLWGKSKDICYPGWGFSWKCKSFAIEHRVSETK